jgi:hypothetical protein
VLAIGALATICQAEPRWCSVSASDPSNKIAYAPIARAARVSGVVLAHMIYVPNGKVERVEPISGPIMLSRSLSDQLMGWTVRTDTLGDELCETLVIANYSFSDFGDSVHIDKALPSILRISIQVEALIISDPGADPSGFSNLRWRLRRVKNWLFRHRN